MGCGKTSIVGQQFPFILQQQALKTTAKYHLSCPLGATWNNRKKKKILHHSSHIRLNNEIRF